MAKIGVVGTIGGWSSEMLADAVEKKTGYRLLIEPGKMALDLPSGRVMCQGVELNRLDALIVKKVGARYSPDLLDRLEILRYLNEGGMPIFSRPEKIMRMLDRLSCTATLQLAGIPMPPTTVTEDVDEAMQAVNRYGIAIFKPLYSTKARGMTLIEKGPDAGEKIRDYKAEHSLLYIQQKIDLPGKDLGIAFMGGKYLTTYARLKNGDSWNTTIRAGGKYEPHTPSPEIIALAKRAQDLFGLDFTGVDLAETAEGPVIFEVSAFGGFRGIVSTSDIDPAHAYVEYVMERIVS